MTLHHDASPFQAWLQKFEQFNIIHTKARQKFRHAYIHTVIPVYPTKLHYEWQMV